MNKKSIYTTILLAILAMSGNKALAAIQDVDISAYQATPPFLDLSGGETGFPSFLLAVSRDNQSLFKAYSDYGDLDGDGIPETTYKEDFEYYGLFNPDLCYRYDYTAAGEGAFIPIAFSARNSDGTYTHRCTNAWSGNFMNWATTTRLDVIQKVIYGGRRIVDTETETYLIGNQTPPDSHSFVKYLDGSALIQGATPIRSDRMTLCRTTIDYDIRSTTKAATPMVRIALGDFRQWEFTSTPCFGGGRSEVVREFDQTPVLDSSFIHVPDSEGNDTTVLGNARPSDWAYNPSRMNPSLEQIIDSSTLALSTLSASSASADTFRRSGFSLVVKVCDVSFINADNKENCLQYPNGEFKPAGMMQRYGEVMRIGMIATSYRSALRGGILRARVTKPDNHMVRQGLVGNFQSEINLLTGVFNLFRGSASGAFSFNTGLIISHLSDIRVQRRNFEFVNDGADADRDYQLGTSSYFNLANDVSCGFSGREIDYQCGSWGNPLAEMIYEGIRYLVGADEPMPDYIEDPRWTSVGSLSLSDDMSWSQAPVDWVANDNLLDVDLACSPMNILALNSSIPSHDADDIPDNANWGGTNAPAFSMSQIVERTNMIGDMEGLHGNSFILPDPTRTTVTEDRDENGNLITTIATFDESNICVYRQLNNLADVRGLCPNAPAIDGSYLSAGAAFFAHTVDMRRDLAEDQNINFLGIEMRPNVPEIIIPLAPDGSSTILLQPGYARRVLGGDFNINRLNRGETLPRHNGRLTQFQAIYPPRWSANNCTYQGVYLIGWEDALAGTDFDVDIIGYLDFKVRRPGSGAGCIAGSGSEAMVEVGTQMGTGSSGDNQHYFGFTIAGTEQDGFHVFSGAYGQNLRRIIDSTVTDVRTRGGGGTVTATLNEGALSFPDPGNATPPPATSAPEDANQVPACDTMVKHWDPEAPNPSSTPLVEVDLRRRNNVDHLDTVTGCAENSPRVSHLFVTTGNSPEIIRSPLYYAAKYGGFKDSNAPPGAGEGYMPIPDLQSEWDALDNRTGRPGADGEPDNYFLVTDPTTLDDALDRALIQGGLNQQTASGTAAALVANEREGLGAVFQALFEPSFEDEDENIATWFGTLHALFIDSRGLLREDSNNNEKLDNYNVDKVIVIRFNEEEAETEAMVLDSSTPDEFTMSGSSVMDIPDLGTIWNAREWLDDAAVGNHRNYTAATGNPGNRRHIRTWIDSNQDGRMQANEVIAFHTNVLPRTPEVINHFDVATEDEMEDIVRFVRGTTNTNNFNRNSGAVRNREIFYDGSAGREKMRLADIINSSPAAVTTPAEAFDLLSGDNTYRDFRRLLAGRRQMVYVGSNGGMLHAFNAGFYDAADRRVSVTDGMGGDPHALGKELWAYVPRALLPHLKWLLDPGYAHSYYVDGSPRVFDAKVYPASTPGHPGGWATILVVGMRLGGGTETRHITIDGANDGIGAGNLDGDTSDDIPALSSYIVVDVTDPEEAPVVLAELAPPGLDLSTSRPAVVPVGGDWYLVFGNGPDLLDTAESSNAEEARLYFYDLTKIAARTVQHNGQPDFTINLPDTEGHFVGGISVADFDLDINAEAIYVTTAGANNQGSVIRVVIDESPNFTTWDTHVLLDPKRPMVSEPTLARDDAGNRWVYAGTGRLFVGADNMDALQHTLYGFIDLSLSLTTRVPISRLEDVTNVRVFTNRGVDLDGGAVDTSYNAFRDMIVAAGGWRRDYVAAADSTPAQRTVNPSTLLGEVLFNTAYTPPDPMETTSRDGAIGCGTARLGESVIIGVDFRTGTPHPFGVFGTDADCGTICNGTGVEEAIGERVLGRGLSSLPSLHLGSPDESTPGQITVVVQQSTGEVQAVQADTVDAAGSRQVDWREYIQ